VTRRSVELNTVRVVLFVWVSIAVLATVTGRGDGRLTLRVVAVLVAAIIVVEGARWMAAKVGPPPRPMLPLVRVVRPEASRVPAALQSWVGLLRAAESDPHVGLMLRERLNELARSRGGPPLADDDPLDAAGLAAAVRAIERLPL
jgi:hypothetical protein